MPLVSVRFSDGDLAAVDRVRGDVPRSTWLKVLAKDAVLAAGVLEDATTQLIHGARDPEAQKAAVDAALGTADRVPVPSARSYQEILEAVAKETGHFVGCGCNRCHTAEREVRA